jgi:hypothetical protein
MVPIIAKSHEKEYTEDEFLSDINRKTAEAIRQNRVLAHCILLYSKSNPFMIKLIDDKTYYDALENISGYYVNIYYANSSEIQRNRHYNTRRNFPTNSEQFTHHELTNINPFNITNDEKNTNNIINKLNRMYHLDIDASRPVMIFFLFDVNTEKIENAFYYELNEISVDALFSEIREILEMVKDCVSEVLDEKIKNQYEIYNLFINNLSIHEIYNLFSNDLKKHKIKNKIFKFISNPVFNLILALRP